MMTINITIKNRHIFICHCGAHTKCCHLISIPGRAVPALAHFLGVEPPASHCKTNHILFRGGKCFGGNYCHVVRLELQPRTHLSEPFSLGGHFLLHGANNLMTIDTNRAEILRAIIASVLPTKTGEGIQGEESGCRSSQRLFG